MSSHLPWPQRVQGHLDVPQALEGSKTGYRVSHACVLLLNFPGGAGGKELIDGCMASLTPWT